MLLFGPVPCRSWWDLVVVLMVVLVVVLLLLALVVLLAVKLVVLLVMTGGILLLVLPEVPSLGLWVVLRVPVGVLLVFQQHRELL